MFAIVDGSPLRRNAGRVWRCFFTALCFYILIGMSPVRASELLPPELVDTPSLQTSGSLPANPLHPALRILFSGNTRGALFPCPT